MGPLFTMRNYLAMLGLWAEGKDGAQSISIVAWGADEDQLREFIQPQINAQLLLTPNMVFKYTGPVKVWFELNKHNFARVLNGPGPLLVFHYALAVWNNTHQARPLGGAAINEGDFFVSMTKVEVEGSPRKVWSHGH